MTQVMRRCITGFHPPNSSRQCADWGSQRMLAFGNGSNIVILVSEPLEQLTTLVGHHANVHRVRWQQESFNHSINVPYRSWLASCDMDGVIIVWDIAAGSRVATFSDSGNKPVLTIEWLSSLQSATRDLLVAVHPSYALIMWNAATGNKLWKKTYTSEIFSFSLDPFDSSRILMLSNDFILLVTDFMISQAPSSDGKKLPIPGSLKPTKSPSNMSLASETNSITSSSMMLSTTRSFSKQISNVMGATGMRSYGDSSSVFSEPALNPSSDDAILQLQFLPTLRDHFVIVQSHKICIVNLEIELPVCNISLDSSLSPFVHVYPCHQRDAFYCLHNNGNVTLRVARPRYSETGSKSASMVYDVRLQSESVRLSKQHKVMALAVCPSSERNISVISSDSRVFFWSVNRIVLSDTTSDQENPTPDDKNHTVLAPLRGVVKQNKIHGLHLRDLYLPSRLFLDSKFVAQNSNNVQLKFAMSGLFTFLGSPPFVLSMCPPLTTKNFLYYKPILAVGGGNGIIYLIDLNSGSIVKEYSIHTGSVAGIEWCSLDSFLSFSVIISGTASNNAKNELVFVECSTGKTHQLIYSKSSSHAVSPLSMIRVSPRKNYFVAVYKFKPMEIWDVKTKRMLREVKMTSTAPITAIAWCPNARFARTKKLQTSEPKTNDEGGESTSPTQQENPKPVKAQSATTESFVFTNSAGLLGHLTVDAGVLQDASRMPPEGGMGNVTAVTWKGDVLALGDNEGGVSLWDLKNKVSRGINVPRIGRVRKLKFAPGKGNSFLLILLVDGIDIWDISDTSHISSLRQKTNMGHVIDADWATSSEPVLAFSDGTVRVSDLYLNFQTTSVKNVEAFMPSLWPSKTGIALKYALLFTDNGTLKWNEDETEVEKVDVQNESNVELAKQINFLQLGVLKGLCSTSTMERCLSVSRIFCDRWDEQFWNVAKFYLTRFKEIDQILLSLDDEEKPSSEKDPQSEFLSKFLDCSASDYVVPNELYRQSMLEAQYVLGHAHTESAGSAISVAKLKDHCARNLLKFGDAEEASVLLLSTDPALSSFHVNSLKTCLINLIVSTGESQKHNEDISKLVATNMIASGFLDAGVEILCMYKNYLDACRYLQSYGNWDESISLAKISLQDSESYQEIVKKWTEFLQSPQINQKNLAILVFISTNQFYKALQLLLSTQQAEKAYLLLKCMQEMGLISNNGEDLDLYKDLQVESKEHLKTAMAGIGFHNVTL